MNSGKTIFKRFVDKGKTPAPEIFVGPTCHYKLYIVKIFCLEHKNIGNLSLFSRTA